MKHFIPLFIVGIYVASIAVLDHHAQKAEKALMRKAASRESMDALLDILSEQRIEVTFKDIVKHY